MSRNVIRRYLIERIDSHGKRTCRVRVALCRAVGVVSFSHRGFEKFPAGNYWWRGRAHTHTHTSIRHLVDFLKTSVIRRKKEGEEKRAKRGKKNEKAREISAMKGRRQRVSGGFEKSVVASHVKPVGQFANARYLYIYV